MPQSEDTTGCKIFIRGRDIGNWSKQQDLQQTATIPEFKCIKCAVSMVETFLQPKISGDKWQTDEEAAMPQHVCHLNLRACSPVAIWRYDGDVDEVHIEGETEVSLPVLLTTKLCLGMKQQSCHMFVTDFLSVEYVDMWICGMTWKQSQAVCHCVPSCMV